MAAADRTGKVAALIISSARTARGKRFAGKALGTVAGRPLLYWVLDAACGCSDIDEVYVAVDDEELAETVRRYPGNVLLIEGVSETGGDGGSTGGFLPALAPKVDADHVCLIEAASPLLRAEQLQAGLSMYFDGRYDAVLSAVRQRRRLWRRLPDGVAVPEPTAPQSRRESEDVFARPEDVYAEAGVFYITSKAALSASDFPVNGRIGIVEVPYETCIEPEDPSDVALVEQLLIRRRREERTWQSRLGNVKVFAMDVDGVLTDGGMVYLEGGGELKKFNAKDGMGIRLLKEAGIVPAVITAERTEMVRRRAEKLGIEFVYQGVWDKVAAAEDLIRRLGVSWAELAYIGDDVIDLPVMRHSGFSAAPADAVEDVRRSVDYVCAAKGGRGCVREVCELLLAHRS